MPAGLGCRDTLRLEMSFCLYGHDIDDTHSPIEAGLGWITKLVEGKEEMIGRKLLEEQKAGGLTRKLVSFELQEKGIGMGYVAKEYAKVGTPIAIVVRGRKLKAEVVKAPFRK